MSAAEARGDGEEGRGALVIRPATRRTPLAPRLVRRPCQPLPQPLSVTKLQLVAQERRDLLVLENTRGEPCGCGDEPLGCFRALAEHPQHCVDRLRLDNAPWLERLHLVKKENSQLRHLRDDVLSA